MRILPIVPVAPVAPVVLLALFAVLAPDLAAQDRDDAFVAGYATALLEREFDLRTVAVTSQRGVLTVRGLPPGEADEERVRQALLRVPGVTQVVLVTDPEPGAAAAAPPGAGTADAGTAGADEQRFLSRRALLFEPLHADPRWPHFAATYQRHVDDGELGNVAAVSFGETFSFVRTEASSAGRFEVGLQAGVFSIFDLDAESFDLVNADYLVGPVLAWQSGRFSALCRLHHQSSHLGDEFLLRTQIQRINLSYEVVDLLASFDATDALRFYAGAGYVVHTDTPLEPWRLQGGAEWFGAPFGESGSRPLIACDLQAGEEGDWHGDLSVRLGVEFTDPAADAARLQLLLEYYRGRSPDGQLYAREVEQIGFGVHLYF